MPDATDLPEAWAAFSDEGMAALAVRLEGFALWASEARALLGELTAALDETACPVREGLALLALLRGRQGTDGGLAGDLRLCIDQLEERLCEGLQKQEEIDGFGLVEKKWSSRSVRWKNDELLPVVVARAADERVLDQETGEYEREGSAVARVLGEVFSFGYARVGALKERGIDPDEFREKSKEGKWSLIF